MRRLGLALLASTALSLSIGGLVGSASAADLPLKAPPPPPVLAYSWTGFYVGVHLGGAWGRKEFSERCVDPVEELDENETPQPANICGGFAAFGLEEGDPFPVQADPSSHQISGPLAGVQVGFNWQNGPVLFGVEAQFSWARLKGDHEQNRAFSFDAPLGFEHHTGTDRFFTTVDALGTIAARFGLVTGPQDRTLVYGKFGAAWVRDKYELHSTGTALDCTVIVVAFCGGNILGLGETENFDASMSGSKNRWGWMVGLGLEFGIWENVTAKVEYNYLGFGKKSTRLAGTARVFEDGFVLDETVAVYRDFDIQQDIQLIKFGVNYRFGWFGKGPVAARY
jgi:outer membrane immunogenic protein